MENNQNEIKLRKIRKIKRSHPQDAAPMTFGTPVKVNFSQEENNTLQESDALFENNGEAENIRFVTNEELINNPESIKNMLHNKTVLLLMMLAGLTGAILSYIMVPQKNNQLGQCLTHVVRNPDVPKGKSRCGVTEQYQGCVLYIMNPMNREVMGRDFYNNAAKWTGRERYSIETGNMKYGNVRIKPGYFAEINIPPIN